MPTDKSSQLKELLNNAMPQLVLISDTRTPSTISLGEYRNAFLANQQPYGTEYPSIARLYKPRVPDIYLGHIQLLLKESLAEYIHEGRIQLAVTGTIGGLGSGFPVEDLARKLLELSVVYGVDHAISRYTEAVTSQNCLLHQVFLVEGLTVTSEIEIYDGIRFVPGPIIDSSDDMSYQLVSSMAPKNKRQTALLVADLFVYPRFMKPNDYRKRLSDPDPYTLTVKSASAPNFNPHKFFRALSLIHMCKVFPVAGWRYMPSDEFSNVWTGTSSGSEGWVPASRVIVSSDEQVQQSRQLYEKLLNLKPETAKRLEIPMNRIIESGSRPSNIDKIINLGIALECLYLPDADQELTFKLCTRGAWHLGHDNISRELLMKQFKAIYNLRSKAVHVGEFPKKVKDADSLIGTAQQLCLQSIEKIMEHGFPKWDKLILG